MRSIINVISWSAFLILINHMTEHRKIDKEPQYKVAVRTHIKTNS